MVKERDRTRDGDADLGVDIYGNRITLKDLRLEREALGRRAQRLLRKDDQSEEGRWFEAGVLERIKRLDDRIAAAEGRTGG